jgi:hypothetical protein
MLIVALSYCYADCRNAGCHCAECCYAECRGYVHALDDIQIIVLGL